jgi:hypothetical protein
VRMDLWFGIRVIAEALTRTNEVLDKF